MENTFQWDDKLVKEFADYTRGGSYPVDEALSKFKASKQKPKEWEIESFRISNGEVIKRISKKDNHFNWWDKNQLHSYSPDQMIALTYDIHSVRRLSDDTLWTVGQDTVNGIIKMFEFLSGYLCAIFSDGEISASIFITSLLLKAPLFTTSDGKEVYEGDDSIILYYVDGNFKKFHCTGSSLIYREHLKLKYFFDSAKADEFIRDNKPMFSVNDIVNWFDEMGWGLMRGGRNSLNEKAEQKINNQ